jgi:hypothetical protein
MRIFSFKTCKTQSNFIIGWKAYFPDANQLRRITSGIIRAMEGSVYRSEVSSTNLKKQNKIIFLNLYKLKTSFITKFI